MSTPLTLTGIAVSGAVLYANLRPWWKAGKDPKGLIPFGQGFGLGAVATICTGGILGWLAGCAAQGANRAGEKGVRGATGTTDTGALAHGSLGHLTPEGATVVTIATAAVVLAWRAAGKLDRRRIVGGAFCGATLCVTAGMASLLGWLPGAINETGAILRSAIEGAGIL